MPDWDAAKAMLEETVAGVFDVTPCVMLPMTDGLSVNHNPQADAARSSFDFIGTIHLEPPTDRIARYPAGDPGTRAGAVSYEAVLTAHVGAWPWFPKMKDMVQDTVTGAVYRVEAAERDGSSRPAIYLSRVRHAFG